MKQHILVGAVALFVLMLAVLPAIAAAEKVTAYGTVIDERGRPVSGVTVDLINDETYGTGWHILGTAISDANGNFRFNNVETNSPYLMVLLNYTENGRRYKTTVNDQQWTDGSQGLVEFNRNYTKLIGYPESDHGYVWGTLLDAAANGRVLDGTVYLANNTTTVMADAGSNGYYVIEASPGDYEIYAVYGMGNSWAVSNRSKITITPSYSVQGSAPLNLIVDVVTQIPPPVSMVSTFTASGTVTDAGGSPVEGATVSVINDKYDVVASTSTDVQGSFLFTNARSIGSTVVKPKVSFVHGGQTYSSSLENTRWYDASAGLVIFDPSDTRLYDYPGGDPGYVWGVVLDNITNGRVMDSIVYLKNDTVKLSTETSTVSAGSFSFKVSPGDYEIYAVHGEGNDQMYSKHVNIQVYPSNDLLQSASINLIVDQGPGKPVAILPMAAALALGIVLIVAGWAIFGRKQ